MPTNNSIARSNESSKQKLCISVGTKTVDSVYAQIHEPSQTEPIDLNYRQIIYF